MSRTRRHFSAEQKASVVRRHLAGKEPVSRLAEELQVQPGLIHLWVNQALAQVERAFERAADNGRLEHAKDRRIEQLEAKLVRKNEVISELMEDNVRQKKVAGGL
jgi:transposase-like protein